MSDFLPPRLAAALCLLLLIAFSYPASAQNLTGQIRLNQVGFYPDAPKVAVVVEAPSDLFYVVTANLADTVFTGTMGTPGQWAPSQETVRLADFSALRQAGSFVVVVPDLGRSYAFEIAQGVHHLVARGALKAFYYQRASLYLRPQYADLWTRPAGHPDTEVSVHPSAASAERPAGTVISSPKGWYDAGDYNKYIVNSGISTGTLLMLYEHYPTYFDALDTNIPESDNGVPDLLDEVLWNLRWMLTMQDPNDGGLYHKLTTPNFEGMVMPNRALQDRYVVQKSTPAALDFAAVTAIAARIFTGFEDELPGLADSCLTAAQNAWNWARRNPTTRYNQSQINQTFNPDINTGEYGDSNFSDEFRWAAAELYVTTRQDSFIVISNPLAVSSVSVPGWPNVGTMGVFSLAHHRAGLTAAVDTAKAKLLLLTLADQLVAGKNASAYGVVMGRSSGDFGWGSNSGAANQGMVLLQAFQLTNNVKYRDAALSNLDYLLGRNATGYSFLTGYGDKPTRFPHHRPSEADAVQNPVPGLLAGGPNPGQQDGCSYPSNLPARSYVDNACSYASNEIAINWNAPMVYLAGAMEATLSPTGMPVSNELGDVYDQVLPERIQIESYPNPSQGMMLVRFSLPTPAFVTLNVFDLMGREVGRLIRNEPLQTGLHERPFDAAGLASGLYLLSLQTPTSHTSHPLLVAR